MCLFSLRILTKNCEDARIRYGRPFGATGPLRLIADAETLIAELNQVGYRISAAVIAQLKSGLA